MRTPLFYFALIGCVLLAFAAGLLSYPMLQPLFHLPAVPAPTAQIADPMDMTVFWEAWYLLDRDFYGEKPPLAARSYGAVRGLTSAFNDPYTRFEEPVQSEASADGICGCYGGIGASIEQNGDGFLLHPWHNQPAAAAGIVDGDRLVQIEDTLITPDLSYDDVIRLERGDIDSEVKIVVQRVVEEPTTAVNLASATGTPTTPASAFETLSFVITRIEIREPSMEWRLLDDNASTAKIGYIRHFLVTTHSPEELQSALAELRAGGAERFILDLRDNPGGPVEPALQMADMWVDDGLLLIKEFANGEQERSAASAGMAGGNEPIAILVNGNTASASEILAGALQDHHRALLIGEQTYGKGSVQLRYTLADNSAIFVTNAQWFTPDYHKISGMGLTPDVPVEAGVDPLSVAIAEVQQLAAVR
ncbi:MAG: S41 family peptidase [Caldilineaceae bacterium]